MGGGQDAQATVSSPQGVKIIRVGVKIPREILTPGGQAARGCLDPRGSSCPGVKINRYTSIYNTGKQRRLRRACVEDCSLARAFNVRSHMSRAMRKCVMSYANNKGADQSAHPRSLISTFVVHCLDNIIPLVSISEISSL